MARKPNFRFERQERERIQAEKRAARDALKEQRKGESDVAAAPLTELSADETGAPAAPQPEPQSEFQTGPEAQAAPAPQPMPAAAEAAANPTAAAPEAPKAAPEAFRVAPEAPRAAPEAPRAAPEAPKAAPEAPKEAVVAAIKALESMTPEQVAILHQNAVRLASSGSAKQRAAAQELLPRLEAELQRLDAAKRQGAAKRPKKQ
jgi:hypothetical protein